MFADYYKTRDTDCDAGIMDSFLVGSDSVCEYQCGSRSLCTAFSMQKVDFHSGDTYTCRLYKTCDDVLTGATGIVLYRQTDRLAGPLSLCLRRLSSLLDRLY